MKKTFLLMVYAGFLMLSGCASEPADTVYEEPVTRWGVTSNKDIDLEDIPESFNMPIDEEMALKIGSAALEHIGIHKGPGTVLNISEIDGENLHVYVIYRGNPNIPGGDGMVYIDKNTGALLRGRAGE